MFGVYPYMMRTLINNKLYLYYDMFGGVCIDEMDANESSETIVNMIDTTDMVDINRLNQHYFKIVFNRGTM